jgi:butyryl-CoA dehydrogenase
MCYRTVGAIDAALAAIPEDKAGDAREIQKRIEEFAVECSVLKVWGSEMLGVVTDHGVQILGGYGYVEDYPAERAYRDARINRIFEGTNEINRLIITGFLMKRAMSGQLALLPAIQALMDEVMGPPQLPGEMGGGDDTLGREAQMLANGKKLALFAAGVASQKWMTALAEEQEAMAAIADMVSEVYALESALLRARKMRQAGEKADRVAMAEAMTQIYAETALERITAAARQVVAAAAEGDALRTELAILRRLAKHEPANGVVLSRKVAAAVIEKGQYSF